MLMRVVPPTGDLGAGWRRTPRDQGSRTGDIHVDIPVHVETQAQRVMGGIRNA